MPRDLISEMEQSQGATNLIEQPQAAPDLARQPRDLITEMSAGGRASQISNQRSQGGFPQKAEGFLESVGDIFTGNARETLATESLPELGSDIGINQFLGGKIPSAASRALLTTTNPVEFIEILQNNTNKEINIRSDEAGNLIAGLDGQEVIINKPGMSKIDLMQLGALGFVFYPAAKVGSIGKNLATRVVAGGTAAGATQAGVEGVQDLAGGDFSKTDIAVAGGGGALSEIALPLASRIASFVKSKFVSGSIPDSAIQEARELAIKIGVEPDTAARLTDDEILSLAGSSDEVAKDGFGISLTKGQRDLDQAQLSKEDSLRSGIQGEGAQKTMLDFEDMQRQQINTAKEGVEQSLGGEAVTTQQAGALAREGIVTAEQAAEDAVSAAYENVGDAALTTEGVNKLLNATRKAVIGVDKDRNLKSTASFLKQINRSQRVMADLSKAGVKPKAQHIKELDNLRKRIATGIESAENNADRSQMIKMKNAFDDYLDEAITKSLFEGDQSVLESLKGARALFSDYAKKFRESPARTKGGRSIPDREGKFIERVISSDPTDEQIVGAVFGASNFSNGSGAMMAKRFKSILGEDSQGWLAIRQAALRRLIKTNKVNGEDVISGQQSLKAFDEAIEKNKSLMSQLFTTKELGLIRQFSSAVKKTQPDLVRSRENPSGTAQVISKSVNGLLNKAPLLGDLGVFMTAKGLATIKASGGKAGAKEAVRPFSKARLDPVGVTTSLATKAGTSALSQKINEPGINGGR